MKVRLSHPVHLVIMHDYFTLAVMTRISPRASLGRDDSIVLGRDDSRALGQTTLLQEPGFLDMGRSLPA